MSEFSRGPYFADTSWIMDSNSDLIADANPKGSIANGTDEGFFASKQAQANVRLLTVSWEFYKAAELLLSQYDESGDFEMGGKLTNKPFLMLREIKKKVDTPVNYG